MCYGVKIPAVYEWLAGIDFVKYLANERREAPTQQIMKLLLLIELDPRYVDTIVRRWQAFTGKSAVCANTGATFADREGAVKTPDIDTTGLATDKGAR